MARIQLKTNESITLVNEKGVAYEVYFSTDKQSIYITRRNEEDNIPELLEVVKQISGCTVVVR